MNLSDTSLHRVLGNFIKILVRVETIFAITILAVLTGVNTIAIFSRAFLKTSFIWIHPFTLMLFSWLTFIGAAVIFYHKEYIVVDYFVNRFLSRHRRPLELIVNFAVMIFLIFIMYEMPGLIKTQTHKMEILNTPTYVLSLPILAGVSTIFLIFVHRTWEMVNPQKQGD